jgi:hypothetical protein
MSFKLKLLAAIALFSLEPPTEAHDIYSPLKDRWGNSCCDDQDCRPVTYRMTPSGVQMLVHGTLIAVPDHAIQYRALPGDTGETAGDIGAGKSTYCRMRQCDTQLTAQFYRRTERLSLSR